MLSFQEDELANRDNTMGSKITTVEPNERGTCRDKTMTSDTMSMFNGRLSERQSNANYLC
jgi:hypothetical protein